MWIILMTKIIQYKRHLINQCLMNRGSNFNPKFVWDTIMFSFKTQMFQFVRHHHKNVALWEDTFVATKYQAYLNLLSKDRTQRGLDARMDHFTQSLSQSPKKSAYSIMHWGFEERSRTNFLLNLFSFYRRFFR